MQLFHLQPRLLSYLFAAALGLSLLVGLGVAVAPVRDLLLGRLKGLGNQRGVRGMARGTGRIHAALVSGEAAVAVLLIVGAMLLIRSVGRLLAVDLGLDPRGVVAVDVAAYGSDLSVADRWRLYRELTARAAQLPGVSSVGLTSRLPIRDGGNQGTITVEGNPDLTGANAPNSLYRPVTPGYFATMGLTVVKGRGIEETDRAGTPRVGLVSESFAAKAWPGRDPIGQRLRSGMTRDTSAITVIGVVEEAKVTSISGSNPFVLYLPLEQNWPGEGEVMVVKSSGSLEQVVTPIRRLVHEIEPRAAIGRVTTMDLAVSGAMSEPLRLRFFLTLFGGLALVLGVVGVYSVVSYSVARRRNEFGVRMALGATSGQVLSQVVLRGLAPVAVGTVIGIVASIGLASVAARFLYGVTATDPLSIGMAGLALLGSGTLGRPSCRYSHPRAVRHFLQPWGRRWSWSSPRDRPSPTCGRRCGRASRGFTCCHLA